MADVGLKWEGELMPIEIKGRESIRIEDGKHNGKIAKLESRDIKDFTYLDTFITLDDVICFGNSVCMKSPFMRFVRSKIPTFSSADVKRRPRASQ